MHKLKSVLENETHKIHWGFKIQMDNPIPVRRPDLNQDYTDHSNVKIGKNSQKNLQETCCHSVSSERLLVKTGVKNS